MQTPAEPQSPVSATDLGVLFSALGPRLEGIVRGDVQAPGPVIEDACQCAWARLVIHADRVGSDRVLSWLARTAVREAFRLSDRHRHELSLEAAIEGGEEQFASPAQGPDLLFEHRERLASLSALPARQRRLAWMHAAGYTYDEISAGTGYTRRTVERQLLRAKQRLRALDAG
jgi:RNA polymerase sigma factor (sigma-70 family)